jgi:hypothetical protein
MSATILLLPTAAQAPVVQQPRRGRLPRSVITMHVYESRKWQRQYDDDTIAERLKSLVDVGLPMWEQAVAGAKAEIQQLQNPNMTPKQRERLAAEIRYDALPYWEKKRLEAMKNGTGQVIQMQPSA